MDTKKHLAEHQSAQKQKVKSLDIPKDNMVLLLDHQEGHKKIQDKYKGSEFVMIHNHVKANVYDIKPVDGKGPV